VSSKQVLDYRRAEAFVADRLESAQWRILARNYRSVGFELDIIAEKGKTLAIVEVKSRRTYLSTPTDLTRLVSRRKKQCLIKGTRHFLARSENKWDTIRFDLALLEQKGPGLNPPVLRYFVGFLTPFE
jgi:putative endonuclease